jgi:3-deoxy-D-manno-octulosonic-acid transferase
VGGGKDLMRFSPFLALYRAAWEPALLAARALAALEKACGGNLWPRRWRLSERLGHERTGNSQVTWMHAASLGESKGLWAVARSLAAQGGHSFVLTTNTVEGLEFLRTRLHAARSAAEDVSRWSVSLAPLDHPRVVRRFLDRQRVGALVLFEGELWPHFVRETKRGGGSVLWISALAPRAPRLLRPVLESLDWTLAQTDADAARLRSAGARAVETGADLRGLHYLEERREREGTRSAPPVARLGIALVSLHADELPVIASALEALRDDVPLLVFPRKMDSLPAFRAALEPLGFRLRSADPRAARQIVDAFGLVGETLGRCRAAVIGGSFAPHGGHNLWEPLSAGVSMAIGPWHASQRYLAEKLEPAGLLKVIRGAPDLGALNAGPDSRAASRLFMETEERLLRGCIEILRTRLVRLVA